jgi:hypothetical protein
VTPDRARWAATEEPRATAPVELLLSAVCALFAAWVLLAQLALLLGWSLRTLFVAFDATVLLGLAAGAVWIRGRRPSGRPRASAELGLLVALSLLCGFLSLAAIRPEVDDVTYAARAVYFLAHPDLPLDLALHDHAFFETPLEYPLLLAYTAELFWAHLAWLLGVDFLDVYHRVAAFAGGALVPLAWALAIERSTGSSRGAVLGAVAVCAYLAVDGVSHNGFGNYAFVRIWQGKVLLLALGVPLFAAFALDWLERPRRGAWLRLFLAAVCANGLTSTALFLLPLLAAALAAGRLAARGPSWRALREVTALGAALLHGVGVGLLLRLSTNPADYHYLGFEVGFPESFAGQLTMVFPLAPPLASAAFAVALPTCLVLLPAERRRFLLGWLAGIVALALNPVVMPLVVDHLATWNAYWRVCYALPFPLVVGVATALLAARRRLSPRATRAAAALLVAAAAATNALAPGPATFGGLRFAPGSYKLRPGIAEELRELASRAAPGPMLAPYDVSSTLPLLSSAFPQLSVERYFLEHFARLHGRPEDAASRHRAALWVGGRSATGLADVQRWVEAGLRNVVVVRPRSFEPGLVALLQGHGFRRELGLERLVLFRRDAGAEAR